MGKVESLTMQGFGARTESVPQSRSGPAPVRGGDAYYMSLLQNFTLPPDGDGVVGGGAEAHVLAVDWGAPAPEADEPAPTGGLAGFLGGGAGDAAQGGLAGFLGGGAGDATQGGLAGFLGN